MSGESVSVDGVDVGSVMDVHGFFAEDGCDIAGLSAWLDGRGDAERIVAVRALTAKEQAALFEAASGVRPIGLDHLVPGALGANAPVIHHGKNSLPMFTHFQKRFCRLESLDGGLVGYNEQATRWATGPGYFVVRPSSETEVLIDYTELPDAHPDGWPTIRPNKAGLSRFIYYGTQDLLRGVSREVSIGRASRGGKPMDNWFVLCREATPNG